MGCAGSVDSYSNYEDSLAAGLLPPRSSMTHEAIYGRYHFDHTPLHAKEIVKTSNHVPPEYSNSTDTIDVAKEAGLQPMFSGASKRDPLSGEIEYYLSVGLKTAFDGKRNFRPALRAIFVIDTSGSSANYVDLSQGIQPPNLTMSFVYLPLTRLISLTKP